MLIKFNNWLPWEGGVWVESQFILFAGFCGINIPKITSSKAQIQHH